MKLTHKQSLAITHYLLVERLIVENDLLSLGELFDDEIRELRIIRKYSVAGKIWNNNNRIYISGWGFAEMRERDYEKQQKEINEYNNNIANIIEAYS